MRRLWLSFVLAGCVALLQALPGASATGGVDLEVVKRASVDLQANRIAYTVSVGNLGPSGATDMVLEDNLPAEVSLLSVTPADACSADAGSVTCRVPRLEVGDGFTATIEARLPSPAPPTVTNEAQVRAAEEDPNPDNNAASVTTVIESPADTSPPVWPPESTLTATEIQARSVTLEWTPARDDVGVAEYRIFQEGVFYVAPGGVLTFDVGALLAGRTYSFKVEACDAAGNCTTDGPATRATTAAAIADLALAKTGSRDPASGVITYTLELTNLGPGDATDIVLTDLLPREAVLLGLPLEGCVEDAGVVTCRIGFLAAGTTLPVTILVGVFLPPPWAITNEAQVRAAEEDPNADNNATSVTTTFVDANVPRWPPGSALTASNVGPTGLTLQWTGAEDDVGVAEYRIFQDGVWLYVAPGGVLTFDVGALLAGRTYSFKVEACDAAGNCTTDGPATTVTTAGTGPAIVAISCSPSYPSAGDPISCIAVHVGGVPPYTVTWDVDDDGSIDGTGTTFTTTFSSPGDRVLRARVTDSLGASASYVLSMTVALPSLLLAKTVTDVNGGAVLPGDRLGYTLEVAHFGPLDLTGVVLTDVLDPNLELVAPSGGCVFDARAVRCAIGTLGAVASVTRTIDVRVLTPLAAGTIIRNQAFVTASELASSVASDDPTTPSRGDPTTVVVASTDAKAVAGRLTFTRFRVRDTDSADKLAFRADYTLGVGTNGIDPVTEPVVITLSNGARQFYSQTLSGFTVTGSAPRRRWVLNDSERARTGIEQLVIDEDPNNSGGIFLRDARTDVGTGDFTNITAEITIGTGSLADKLSGMATLVQKRAGSGKWRLSRER